MQVSVDTAGLITGTYYAAITVEAETGILDSPAQIPVTLVVTDHVYQTYLPTALRHPDS